MEDKISGIANGLIKDANIFYSKAQTYKNYREVDGTLVNLLLSANNLNKAIEIITNLKDQGVVGLSNLNILEKIDGSNNLEEKPCDNAEADIDSCIQILQEILLQILNETKEVQLHLRQTKSSGKSSSNVSGSSGKDSGKASGKKGSSGNEKEEQGIKCEDIKEQSIDSKFFSDIIGAENAKKRLEEAMIYPYKYPNLYKSRGKSLLLYGPPGTGKTFMVKAAVNELKSQLPEITVKWRAPTGADLKGKYVGETEKRITSYFDCAAKDACVEEDNIKELSKKNDKVSHKRVISILFLDEVEAIAGDRVLYGQNMTSSVNTLLQKMDGITASPNVFVIAATNYPWQLDGAVLRRFQERIFFDLPNKKEIGGLITNYIAEQFVINGRETLVRYDKTTGGFVEDNSDGNFIMEKMDDGTYADDVETFCKEKLEEIKQEKEKEDDDGSVPTDTESESETGLDKKWEEKFLKDLNDKSKRDKNNTPDPDMYDVSTEKVNNLFSSNILQQIRLSKDNSSVNPYQAKEQFKKNMDMLVDYLYENLFSQDDLKNFILKANKWASSQSTGDDISFYQCEFKSNKDSEFGKNKTYFVPEMFVNTSNSSIRKPKKVINNISGSDGDVNRFKNDHSINLNIFTTKDKRYVLNLQNDGMTVTQGDGSESKFCKVDVHNKDDCKQINKLTMKFINSDYVKDSEYFRDIETYNEIDTFYLASAEYNQKIKKDTEEGAESEAVSQSSEPEGTSSDSTAAPLREDQSDVSNFMYNAYVLYQLNTYFCDNEALRTQNFIEGSFVSNFHRDSFENNFKAKAYFLLFTNKATLDSFGINIPEFTTVENKYLILSLEGENINCIKGNEGTDIIKIDNNNFKNLLNNQYTSLFNICDIEYENVKDKLFDNVTEDKYNDFVQENKISKVNYLPSFSITKVQGIDRPETDETNLTSILKIPLQYYKVDNIVKFLEFISPEKNIDNNNLFDYRIIFDEDSSNKFQFEYITQIKDEINKAFKKLRLKLIKPRFFGDVNVSKDPNVPESTSGTSRVTPDPSGVTPDPSGVTPVSSGGASGTSVDTSTKPVEDKLYNNIFDNVADMYNESESCYKFIDNKYLVKSTDDSKCHKFITSKDLVNKEFCAELNILKKNTDSDCIYYNHINNFIPQDDEKKYYATHDIFVNKNKENKSDLIIQNYQTIEVTFNDRDTISEKNLPKIYDTVEFVIENDDDTFTSSSKCQILSRKKLADNKFELSVDMEDYVNRSSPSEDLQIRFQYNSTVFTLKTLAKNRSGDNYKFKTDDVKNPFYILPILKKGNEYDYSIIDTVNNIINDIEGEKKITDYINFFNDKPIDEILVDIKTTSITNKKDFLTYYISIYPGKPSPQKQSLKAIYDSRIGYEVSCKNLLIKNSNSADETKEVDFGILDGIFDREDRDGNNWENINYFTNNIYLLNLINNYEKEAIYNIVQKYINDSCIVVQQLTESDIRSEYSVKTTSGPTLKTYGISIKSIILANVSDDFIGENFNYIDLQKSQVERIEKFAKQGRWFREQSAIARTQVKDATKLLTETSTQGGGAETVVATGMETVAANASAAATGALTGAVTEAEIGAAGAAGYFGISTAAWVTGGIVLGAGAALAYYGYTAYRQQKNFIVPNGKQYFDLDFKNATDEFHETFKEDVKKNLTNLQTFVNFCAGIEDSATQAQVHRIKTSINYDAKPYQVDTYLEDKKNKYHFILNRLKSTENKPIYFLRKKQSTGLNLDILKDEQKKIIRKMNEREKIEKGADNVIQTKNTVSSQDMIKEYCNFRREAGLETADSGWTWFGQLTSLNRTCYNEYLKKEQDQKNRDIKAYDEYMKLLTNRSMNVNEKRGEQLKQKWNVITRTNNLFNYMYNYAAGYGSYTSITSIKDRVQERIDQLDKKVSKNKATDPEEKELTYLKNYQEQYLKNTIEEMGRISKWRGKSASTELDMRKERNNISGVLAKTQDPSTKMELKQKLDMLDNQLYNLSESKKISKSIENIVPDNPEDFIYKFCDLFRKKNISNIFEIVNSSYYLFFPYNKVKTGDKDYISYEMLMIDSPDNQEDFINLTNDFLLEDDTCDLYTQIKFQLSFQDKSYENDILFNYLLITSEKVDNGTLVCDYKNSKINHPVQNKFNTLYFNEKNNYNESSSILDMNLSVKPNYFLVNMVDMLSNKDIFTPNVNGEFKAEVNDLFKQQVKFNNLEGYGRLLKLNLINKFSNVDLMEKNKDIKELINNISEENYSETNSITNIQGYAQFLNKNMIVPYDIGNPHSGLIKEKLSVILPQKDPTIKAGEYRFDSVYNNEQKPEDLTNNNKEQHFCIKIDDKTIDDSNKLPTSSNMKFPDYIFTDELDIYNSIHDIKFTRTFINDYKAHLNKGKSLQRKPTEEPTDELLKKIYKIVDDNYDDSIEFLTGKELSIFKYIHDYMYEPESKLDEKLKKVPQLLKESDPGTLASEIININDFVNSFGETMDKICKDNNKTTLEDVIFDYFCYTQQSVGLLQFLTLFNPKDIDETSMIETNQDGSIRIKYGTFINNIYVEVIKKMIPNSVIKESELKLKFGSKVIHGCKAGENDVRKNLEKFKTALKAIDISKSKLELPIDNTLIYENLSIDEKPSDATKSQDDGEGKDKKYLIQYKDSDIVIVDMSKLANKDTYIGSFTDLKNHKYLSYELITYTPNNIIIKLPIQGEINQFEVERDDIGQFKKAIVALDVVKMCENDKRTRINEICKKYVSQKFFEFGIYNQEQLDEDKGDQFIGEILLTISEIKGDEEQISKMPSISSVYKKLYEKLKIFDKTLGEIDMSHSKIKENFRNIYERLKEKLHNICLENMINMAYNPDFNCIEDEGSGWNKQSNKPDEQQIPGRLETGYIMPTAVFNKLKTESKSLVNEIREITSYTQIPGKLVTGVIKALTGIISKSASGGHIGGATSDPHEVTIDDSEKNIDTLHRSVTFLRDFENFIKKNVDIEGDLENDEKFKEIVKNKGIIEAYVRENIKMLSDTFGNYLNIYKNIFEDDDTITIEPENKFTEYKNLLRVTFDKVNFDSANTKQKDYYTKIEGLVKTLMLYNRKMEILNKVEKMSREELIKQIILSGKSYDELQSLNLQQLRDKFIIEVLRIDETTEGGTTDATGLDGIYPSQEFIETQIKNIDIVKATEIKIKKLKEGIMIFLKEKPYINDFIELLNQDNYWKKIVTPILEKLLNFPENFDKIWDSYLKRKKDEFVEKDLDHDQEQEIIDQLWERKEPDKPVNDKEKEKWFQDNFSFVLDSVVKPNSPGYENILSDIIICNFDKIINEIDPGLNISINDKYIYSMSIFKEAAAKAKEAAKAEEEEEEEEEAKENEKRLDRLLAETFYNMYLQNQTKEKIFSLHNESCKNLKSCKGDTFSYEQGTNFGANANLFKTYLGNISLAISNVSGELEKQYKNLSEIIDELGAKICQNSKEATDTKQQQVLESIQPVTVFDDVFDDSVPKRKSWFSWLGLTGGADPAAATAAPKKDNLHILSSIDNFNYCIENTESTSQTNTKCITGKDLYCKNGITTYTELENKSSKNTQFKDGEIMSVKNMDKKKRVFYADPKKMFEIHVARPLQAKKPTGDKSALIWEAKSSIVKEMYALMLYYENTGLNPTDKERITKAYAEAAKGTYTPDRGVKNGVCQWAKDLKTKDDE